MILFRRTREGCNGVFDKSWQSEHSVIQKNFSRVFLNIFPEFPWESLKRPQLSAPNRAIWLRLRFVIRIANRKSLAIWNAGGRSPTASPWRPWKPLLHISFVAGCPRHCALCLGSCTVACDGWCIVWPVSLFLSGWRVGQASEQTLWGTRFLSAHCLCLRFWGRFPWWGSHSTPRYQGPPKWLPRDAGALSFLVVGLLLALGRCGFLWKVCCFGNRLSVQSPFKL